MAEAQIGRLSVKLRGQIIQGLGTYVKEFKLYCKANGELLENF